MNIRPVVLLDLVYGHIHIPPTLAHSFANHLKRQCELKRNIRVRSIYERLQETIVLRIAQAAQNRQDQLTPIRPDNHAVARLRSWSNTEVSTAFTFTEVRLAVGLDTKESEQFFVNWDHEYAVDLYRREPDHDFELGFDLALDWQPKELKKPINIDLAKIPNEGVKLVQTSTQVQIAILQKTAFQPSILTLRQIAMKLFGSIQVEPDVRGMDRIPEQALTRLNSNNRTQVRDLVARCRKVSQLIPDNNLAVSEIEAIATALEALSFLDNTDISLLRKITSLLVRTIKPLTGRAGKVAKWVVQISDGVDELDAELKRQEDPLLLEAPDEPALSDD